MPLLLKRFIFVYVCVVLCPCEYRCSQRSEEVIRSPGVGIMDYCELLYVGAELRPCGRVANTRPHQSLESPLWQQVLTKFKFSVWKLSAPTIAQSIFWKFCVWWKSSIIFCIGNLYIIFWSLDPSPISQIFLPIQLYTFLFSLSLEKKNPSQREGESQSVSGGGTHL